MAAPQTGLTSCQIGDTGHPRTVHARYIPDIDQLMVVTCLYMLYVYS